MKEIIFGEDRLSNLDAIGKELLDDEQDPRSAAYVRKLNRPKISVLKIIAVYVLFPTLILIALNAVLTQVGISAVYAAVITIIILAAYVLLAIKRIFICAVKIYQKYAPASVRNKCRFEPSCSEYMILAVEKYGFIKGLRMGIDRLKRCNINGGGFDYP